MRDVTTLIGWDICSALIDPKVIGLLTEKERENKTKNVVNDVPLLV